MGKAKISIIIPVYKVPEEYLNKCISSIMDQSLEDIEIVLVDDGSPDNCGNLCDLYSQKDSRVKSIHKANGGLASARNYGFNYSHGEWVMFVDADDWIEPTMCEMLYNTALKNNVDIVMCGMIKDYGDKQTNYHYGLVPNHIYSGEECKWLQEQVLNFNGNISTTVTKLYKKELLLQNSIYHKENLRQGAEGIEFNLRVFGAIRNAIYIDQWLYHYTYNPKSISTTHNEKNHQYVVECFREISNEINIYDNRDELYRWLNNRLIYVIITIAVSGYFNPDNKDNYKEKCRKYSDFLNQDLLQSVLHKPNYENISLARRIIFMFIKLKCFFPISVLGKIRKVQKQAKG